MNEQSKNLETERLFEAAEAVLAAVKELAARGTGPIPLAEVIGTPAEPKCLWDYTREEVHEASAFLGRMGFLPGRAAA